MGVYDQDSTGAATVGSSSGQQQATLSFEDACTLVQDPFGHVFDSHTLEPLANASVEITQKNAKGNFEKLASQVTGKSGGYSFYVKDGTYRITASKANYTFPGKAANLNKNASSLYSNLYYGDDIIQNGTPEQRDIPLDPIDKKIAEAFAQRNPIEFINYFQTFNKADKF
jgi:protocatechuate 3,4-dioxygenase beta subunit